MMSTTAADPLPSWHDRAAKLAVIDFVTRVTRDRHADFVPPQDRIAVFDNDGTLWVEQPMYTQLAFALDRVRALAPAYPEWQTQQPFKAVLENNLAALAATGEQGAFELIAATHANDTTDEFREIVIGWLMNARHPTLRRPYTECVYQPMIDMLSYLRANGFTTFIVSGGGVEFMRPWTQRVYGVPPEQVIGSRVKLHYEYRGNQPVLYRLPEVELVDDRAAKPAAIYEAIGRRPILAFGNSDGDYEMLEWTTAGAGPRLGVLVHHTDAEREFAYDRDTHFGRLSRALEAAPDHKWVVVDMARDWRKVFALT